MDPVNSFSDFVKTVHPGRVISTRFHKTNIYKMMLDHSVPAPKQDKAQPKKKEKAMCYDCDCDSPRSDEKIMRDQLNDRIYEIAREHDTRLEKAFGIRGEDHPRTPAAVVELITSGKFVIDEGKEDHNSYNPLDYFTFRDPAIKKDQKGYEAAYTKLTDTRQKYLDKAAFGDLTDALKIIEDFKSDTFH